MGKFSIQDIGVFKITDFKLPDFTISLPLAGRRSSDQASACHRNTSTVNPGKVKLSDCS